MHYLKKIEKSPIAQLASKLIRLAKKRPPEKIASPPNFFTADALDLD